MPPNQNPEPRAFEPQDYALHRALAIEAREGLDTPLPSRVTRFRRWRLLKRESNY